MARVTVEDCLKNVKNRFELVIIASRRARQLMRGKEAKVEWDNDKATVVALREIAEGHTNFETPSQEEQETAAMLHSLNASQALKEQQKAAAAALEAEDDEDDEDLSMEAGSEEGEGENEADDLTHDDGHDNAEETHENDHE